MAVAKKPQVTRIRAIHLRAPNLSMPALLGISKIAYPMKKIPAPRPNAAALKPRSSLIVRFAKPTLLRSRKAKKYRKTISGNTRRLTLRIVRSPSSPSDSVDVRGPGIAASNHEWITRTKGPSGRHGRCGHKAANLSLGSTNSSWAAYVFAVPPPIAGATPAQGRLILQLPMRQLLGVGHVKG